MPKILLLAATVLLFALPDRASAQAAEFVLVLQDHRFEPVELRVPANVRLTLIIDNRDPTPEEFESEELRAEKIIPGNTRGSVMVGPLAPGVYPFVGEFNEDTARGTLVAE